MPGADRFARAKGKVGYRHGDDGADLVRTVAFLTEYALVDRIICLLKLTFIAKKPPPDLKFLTLVPGRDILFL